MQVFSFTVEGKPQGKGRARSALRGRFVHHYTPEKTVAYEKQIAQAARLAFKQEPFAGPVCLRLDIVMPWPASTPKSKLQTTPYATQKPDLDNIAKAFCDGMNGVVWVDDCQVVRLIATKKRGIVGHVKVTVGLMTDAEGRGDNG
jgi:Holliday junction resolvase RusA-like endonuclease